MQSASGDVFGSFKPERVAKDYETVTTAFGTKPYDHKLIFTNEYLDPSIKK
jgi:hypothetical protein